jgi:hypothetical protein
VTRHPTRGAAPSRPEAGGAVDVASGPWTAPTTIGAPVVLPLLVRYAECRAGIRTRFADEAVVERLRALWTEVRTHLDDDVAGTALDRLAVDPYAPAVRELVRARLDEALGADPAFTREVRHLAAEVRRAELARREDLLG